jgi:hypothetical protein
MLGIRVSRRVALAVALVLLPALAVALPTPTPKPLLKSLLPLGIGGRYGIAAPANLTIDANPADCKTAVFGSLATTLNPHIERDCETELAAHDDVLVRWTWSRTPCGAPSCLAENGFVFGVVAGTPLPLPTDGSFAADGRASIQALSYIKSLHCVNLQAQGPETGEEVSSATSNSACYPPPAVAAPRVTSHP